MVPQKLVMVPGATIRDNTVLTTKLKPVIIPWFEKINPFLNIGLILNTHNLHEIKCYYNTPKQDSKHIVKQWRIQDFP